MDRKQAQSLKNKVVRVEEGVDGKYLGILQNVIAQPRKPWKGIVQIIAIDTLPIFEDIADQTQLKPLKYRNGEIIECEGMRLSAVNNSDNKPSSFEMSLVDAVEKRNKELTVSIELMKQKQDVLRQFLSEHGLNKQIQSHAKKEGPAITYTFHHDGDEFILVDENENRLDLKDCPFTLSWKNQHEWINGKYEENGTFISEDDVRYAPKEGAVFVIKNEQFDPYVILRNELEPTALSSLEKNLERYQITHDDLVECHNSLLAQLLQSDGKKSFQGVNFLTYRGPLGTIIVQHHYERMLQDYNNDRIYDRFEITTEQGKRSISTYTNAYSL